METKKMETINLSKINFLPQMFQKRNRCKFGVGRFGDNGRGTNETFQLFSLHRTENGAIKRLRSIKGIGHLHVVAIED